MGPGLVTMSTREFDRLEILRRVVERSLTQTKAAELMGLSERQVRRLESTQLTLRQKERLLLAQQRRILARFLQGEDGKRICGREATALK